MHLLELECEFAICCAEAVRFSRNCAAVNDIDGTDALEVETDFFAAYASLWCFFSVVSFCLLMFLCLLSAFLLTILSWFLQVFSLSWVLLTDLALI